MTTDRHSDNFTVLRLLLAGMVLYSHSFAMVGDAEPVVMARTMGNVAVHGFFVVSGYLVSGSYIRVGPVQFIIRRALRLLPGYLLGIALGSVLFTLFAGYPRNAIPGIANGSLWTIPWELLMYLGVFILGTFALLRADIVGALFVMGIALVGIHLHDANTGVDVIAPMTLMFLGGALIRLNEAELPKWLYPLAAALMLVAFAPVTGDLTLRLMARAEFAFGWGATPHEVRYLAYLLLFPAAVIYLCRHVPLSIPLKADLSYGVFVFGWPVQSATVALLITSGVRLHSGAILFIVTGAATLLLAALSWFLIEKPILRLKDHPRLQTW